MSWLELRKQICISSEKQPLSQRQIYFNYKLCSGLVCFPHSGWVTLISNHSDSQVIFPCSNFLTYNTDLKVNFFSQFNLISRGRMPPKPTHMLAFFFSAITVRKYIYIERAMSNKAYYIKVCMCVSVSPVVGWLSCSLANLGQWDTWVWVCVSMGHSSWSPSALLWARASSPAPR